MSKHITKSWRAENTVIFLRNHGVRLAVFGAVFVVALVLVSMYFAAQKQSSQNAAIAFLSADKAQDFAALTTQSGAGAYSDAAAFIYGQKLYEAGDYDKAASVFEEFTAKNKDHFLFARALAARGYCLERKGDFSAARKLFETANETETNPAWKQDNLISIARCAEGAGDKSEALTLYIAFNELYPNSIWNETVSYRISLLNRK